MLVKGEYDEIEVTKESEIVDLYSVILECIGDQYGNGRDEELIKEYAQMHECSSFKIIGPGYQGTFEVIFYGHKISILNLINDHFQDHFVW